MSTVSEFFRHHIDNWGPAVTGLLAGTFVGIFLASTLAGVPLDAGFTQLIGSAAGAGIAALAAIIVAQHQTNAPNRNYEKFVADSALGVRDEAHILKKFCEIEAWDSNAQWGSALLTQANTLRDVIALFQGNAPYNGTTNYKVRLRCAELDRALRLEERTIEKEIKWLGTPTNHVLQNARPTLTDVSERLLEACGTFSETLGCSRPPPTDEIVNRKVYDLQDDGEVN
ncbi:MAG: hypothetical protein ACKVP3_07975 [Hyphomicrobiaceae bacterium]